MIDVAALPPRVAHAVHAYDVPEWRRALALAAGAVPVTGGDGTYRRLRRALRSGEYDLTLPP